MIEYIKGILAELNPTEAVVEAAGVGYDIAITLPTYSALIDVQSDDVQSTTEEINNETNE